MKTRTHADTQIEKHAANCVQCLDATEQYNRVSGSRFGYSSREVWLDMIDDLHEWDERS